MTWGRGAVCEDCWTERFPGVRMVRVIDLEPEDADPCVFCGQSTTDGIYWRCSTEEVNFPEAVKTA